LFKKSSTERYLLAKNKQKREEEANFIDNNMAAFPSGLKKNVLPGPS
jgi:hypothetical protein